MFIKSIIKFAIVFIMSFLCFNQGMIDFFGSYIPTATNIIMIVAPFLAMIMFIVNESVKQSADSENKSGDLQNREH